MNISQFAELCAAFKIPINGGGGGGTLTYLGAWDANANSPTLVSSVGTANTFYIVSVAGSTNLNGITAWNVGDWAVFNGSVWTRIPNVDTITLNGDSGTASGGDLSILTGNPGGCGSTVKFTASGTNVILEVSDNGGNIFLGAASGVLGMGGFHNQGIGNESFDSGTFGGSYNSYLGRLCGTAYTGSESNNILIRNTGVLGDNNIARIGTRGTGAGQQSRCFLPGGYGVSPLSGAVNLAMDANGELCEGTSGGGSVSFQNNYFIADNGSDSTGDGSLSAPFFTANHTLSVIGALTPSATNEFYIHDERTIDIVEDFQLLPFVTLMGIGVAKYHGDASLHSSFGSITTDAYTTFGGYKEWQAGSTLGLNFSSFGLTNQIVVNLIDVPKAPIEYPIVGNDGANFNMSNFVINEINFNTYGRDNLNNSVWQANCTMASGVRRKIRYCNGWQVSSITKSLGSVPCITELDVAFCGESIFSPSTGTLQLISTGGANNQPIIQISVLSCRSGNSGLALDITNDGASFVYIITDITSGYYISSANSLTNIAFQNYSPVDTAGSVSYTPTNYTPTSYDNDGFTVTIDLLGAHLKGIDNALSASSPAIYYSEMQGFQMTWNDGSPATVTINPGTCIDSLKTYNMAMTAPITVGTTDLDTGTWTADTWYGVWLFENSTTHATTVLLSLSLDNPVSPSGYDKKRLIRTLRAQSTGTQILAFWQDGKYNQIRTYWDNADNALAILVNGNATSGAPGTLSLTEAISPLSTCVDLNSNYVSSSLPSKFSISSTGFPTGQLAFGNNQVSGVSNYSIVPNLVTDSGRGLSYHVNNSGDSLTLLVNSFVEYF